MKTNQLARQAFTLIELLVVISIIAILAGIAMPVFTSIMTKGKMTADMSNLRQIGMGVAAYVSDHDDIMPPGDTLWVLYATGQEGPLFGYCDKSYKVWQSKFDPRITAEGEGSHVSFSFNGKVLAPTQPPSTPEAWNGNIMRIQGTMSKLVLAAPNFGGKPSNPDSWGLAGANVAKSVKVLEEKGTSMNPDGLGGKKIPVVFMDFHTEIVKMKDYQGTSASTADRLVWDPLVP